MSCRDITTAFSTTFQVPHVSRPWIGNEPMHGRSGKPTHILIGTFSTVLKMLSKNGNVIFSFSQGRDG